MKYGQLLVTSGIRKALDNDIIFCDEVNKAMKRYSMGDWGDLCKEDKQLNDDAIKNGDDLIVARYNLNNDDIYIITEWDRSATTIMFTYDY